MAKQRMSTYTYEADDGGDYSTPRYGVWCEVWGGATGSREGWMRSNDRIVEFDNLADAEAEASKQQAQTMAHPHRVASFRYTVRER